MTGVVTATLPGSGARDDPATAIGSTVVVRNGMTSEQEHPEPVIVGTFGSVGEAEIAQAKLRAYGIESALVDNDGGGTIPVDSDDGIDLEVRAADARAAADVLADTEPDVASP
jgi:hypothetical protein